MKRYIHILTLTILCAFTSCVMDDPTIDISNTPTPGISGLHIVGAVEDFDVRNVGTRAEDEVSDSRISEMTMLVFKADGSLLPAYSTSELAGAVGDDANPISSHININKSNPTFLIEATKHDTYGILASMEAGITTKYYDNNADGLDKCSIYIVANAYHLIGEALENYEVKSLADLNALLIPADDTLQMPKNESGDYRGFPMIGTHELEWTNSEGQTFIGFDLSKDSENLRSVATIPLKKLYSKICFRMQVNSNQIVDGGATPKFTLKNIEIFNIPSMIRMGYSGTDYDSYTGEIENPYIYSNTPKTLALPSKTTASHSASATTDDIIEFSFYMPEHKVTPYFTETTYTDYPPNMPTEFRQYYKPKLIASYSSGGTQTGDKVATFVRIYGTYNDHNAEIHDVTYDIYLGQDETDDFEIKRNQQLNNTLVITGITNHKGAYPDTSGNVSIDHRVSVTNKGYNLSMERTAILDSHFEVRPLDIELQKGSAMTVTIPEDHKSWIAMEPNCEAVAKASSGLYVDTSSPRRAVRKYFTTTLVKDLWEQNSGTYTIKHSGTDTTEIHRIWFYIDENPNVYDKELRIKGYWKGKSGYPSSTTTDSYDADTILYRLGKVNFHFTKDGTNPDTSATPTTVVNFQQWNLWRVWNSSKTRYYDIEHEEEYLNNYASDQAYGETQNGMPWGLDGVQLSNKVQAAYVREDNGGVLSWILNTFSNGFTEWVNTMISEANISPYYDFYLTRDNPYSSITPRDYSGRAFNEEIADYLNTNYSSHQGSSNGKAKIEGILLNETPKSAFAYCYNKNKRNSNGEVVEQKWILPAIDELEDIALGAYDEFDGVFQDQEYWSCQPAFTKNIITVDVSLVLIINGSTDGSYYEDDINRARATSIIYNPDDPNANDAGFANISSGVDGNSKKMAIKNKSWRDSELVYQDPVSTGETISYHEGNNSRTTDICRIRAVYRSGNVE